MLRYIGGEREDYPGFPENYIRPEAANILNAHSESVVRALGRNQTPPAFPEAEVTPLVDNTWIDTGKSIFNNWLGLVYQLTDTNRKVPYMSDVNREDPLGLGNAGANAVGL